ncbi:carbohydrate ABC transporter permease [Thermoanaerobacterium saccharolyticum]|uniref:carbohydrate ABC transporter permease n=1 Tax=Thermoanaerobacterium saccharolyticum TaxID=28896 RepID=UPI002FDB0CFD
MTKKFSLLQIILYVFLTVFSVIIISPLVIVLSSSLRTPENMKNPLILFNELSFKSYEIAFQKMNFENAFLTSIITTVGSVLVIILIASMVAYPISRIKSKISNFLYYFFIAGLIVPSQMVVVPIAQQFGRLNIPSNRFTPMIMFITCSLPFSVFLYAGFMKSVPIELEEAAYIDGASIWTRFIRIVFPLLQPASVAVAITQGMWIWNDYFYPMIFVSERQQYSLPVAMLQFLGDKENPAQWNILFAACVLTAIPVIIIFALLQKQFINGITVGAVKG